MPSNYVPANLVVSAVELRLPANDPEMLVRRDMGSALEKLFLAAGRNGFHLMLASGYRSYSAQANIYNAEAQDNGQTGADKESARPGHSEHQTGLAADIEPSSRNCEIQSCFGSTAEGKWLAANSYKYGFILRYQKGKDSLTGYEYEPWHLRFVGIDLSGEITRTGQTLEQFFSLSAYPDYPTKIYQLH